MLIESPTMPPTLLPLEEAEPAKEAPRKRRWWQRKPNDAQILRHAINVIDERGWTTGAWIDRRGRVCLLGAVGVAALESGRKRYYASFESSVIAAADKVVGRREGLHYWNDRLGWSGHRQHGASTVKAKLAEMAEIAEANGGKYPR